VPLTAESVSSTSSDVLAAWMGVVVAMRATVRAARGAPNGGTPKIAQAVCPEHTNRRTIDLR
jgi:hypothetical protein